MKSTHANCSSLIKKELKAAFPNVKFSVKSDYNTVNINWTDGVTKEKVNKIVSKYKCGHFDGMTDCYEYDNTNEEIPQVKYVFTNRTMSDKVRDLLIAKHNENFVDELRIDDINAYNEQAQCYNSSLIYRMFIKMDF